MPRCQVSSVRSLKEAKPFLALSLSLRNLTLSLLYPSPAPRLSLGFRFALNLILIATFYLLSDSDPSTCFNPNRINLNPVSLTRSNSYRTPTSRLFGREIRNNLNIFTQNQSDSAPVSYHFDQFLNFWFFDFFAVWWLSSLESVRFVKFDICFCFSFFWTLIYSLCYVWLLRKLLEMDDKERKENRKCGVLCWFMLFLYILSSIMLGWFYVAQFTWKFKMNKIFFRR